MNRSRSLFTAVRPFTLLVVMGFSVSGLSACSRSKIHKADANRAPSARHVGAAEGDAVALCSALHELPMRRRAECCAEPPVAVYFDECVRLLSSAVRARTVSIDGSKVTQCAARVAETTSGCEWVAPTLAAPPVECDGAVRGLVDEGGRCTSSLECRGALHCRGQGATTPGVCKAPEPVGGACGTSVDSLATYLGVRALEERKPQCGDFCDLTTHRCAAKPAVGAACNASVNCAFDQACRNRHCELLEGAPRDRRSPPGGACVTDLDCRAGGCVTNAAGERLCAKKCSNELASLARRTPMFLTGSSARTSTRSESASR